MLHESEILAAIQSELQAWYSGKRIDPQTKHQLIYALHGTGHFKAFIDVCVTDERDAPSISACRYAALPLADGWVVYDRLLSRIVNGTFYGEGAAESALAVAQSYNEDPTSSQDMSPNGLALGLQYPVSERHEEEAA